MPAGLPLLLVAFLLAVDATVNFDWGGGTPDPSLGIDTFTVRWQGKVEPQYSQTYTFYTQTDDGVRLWVNGQLLIDKWIDQGPTEWSGQIALTAGQRYDIVMEFYENGGGAMARLSWSSASQPKQIIPQSRLYLPGSSSQVAIEWLVADQLGTPRMIFDKTGALANVRRHDYLPFGEELAAGQGGRTTGQGYVGDNVRQKFTQKERDNETGLDFFEARYYTSAQGRFTSPDPLLSSGVVEIPQSWNRYTYVLGNPLVFVDPTGELWIASNDAQNPYRWVDECPQGGTCYQSIAVGTGNQNVRIYGTQNQNDITNYAANEDGMINVADIADHPNAQFESVAGPANDPEEYLNPTNAVALFNAAQMYHDAHPDDAKLVFTGGSNEDGQSANDANGRPIHRSHRNGDNIDMRYMGADGQPLRGVTAADNADAARMASLWGAFRNQSPGLAGVLNGNPARFGLQPINRDLQNIHRNHFHLQRNYPAAPAGRRP